MQYPPIAFNTKVGKDWVKGSRARNYRSFADWNMNGIGDTIDLRIHLSAQNYTVLLLPSPYCHGQPLPFPSHLRSP